MKKLILLIFCLLLIVIFTKAQTVDSVLLKDSIHNLSAKTYSEIQNNVLQYNPFINNSTPSSVDVAVIKHNNIYDKNAIFYLLAGIILFLAIIRRVFLKYFITLFRVFFNTSLRQSQLVDQLTMAKLPSLIFNIFFVVAGGIYVYLILSYYQLLSPLKMWFNIAISIVGIAVIYVTKFCTLKFTGWISGYQEEADTYTFVVFLVNKIVGILLAPFIVIIAFSNIYLAQIAIVTSFLLLAMFMLLRFIRSYSLLQRRIQVSPYHFFLYIIGVEFLPLLLIHKALLIFLLKKS